MVIEITWLIIIVILAIFLFLFIVITHLFNAKNKEIEKKQKLLEVYDSATHFELSTTETNNLILLCLARPIPETLSESVLKDMRFKSTEQEYAYRHWHGTYINN